ncbi:Holliday junction branch migration DNA helicase RuvB [Pigmentibacter ruber]|uniref:Holliday junction branch migration DNA helicase RuvB n=1 Tax=Pigmentibacter ruber TaxID=2683196 RepID=UPI00131CEA88|nr:Holliday junction branch migration DNA helicase RuvB [Pigmentibacter ruber]BFD32139.1 Holliday junction branch migration DNA helicase RuvB [Pigmentibacter ruber]
MNKNIHTKFENQVILPELATDPIEPHLNLRPKCFDDYPGQERVCDNLKIYTKAAQLRGKMLDHCLFHGPPGLGKTTLAGIIAETMQYQFKVTAGPVIERPADLMGILASLEPKTILFIDEIHRLPANVEEILYSAMEDMRLDILIGQGPTARTVKFDLPPFCIIGATTRAGAISAPLRDRFGIQEHLDFYSPEALSKILLRSAKIMNYSVTTNAAFELAKRCRGTPRIANQLLKRVLDFAIVLQKNIIDEEVINNSLKRLGVDEEGLCNMDRDFLQVMYERYAGGPVGLDAIAAALNEEKSTLEDVYEPYLVYRGFVLRSARGRILSESGKSHIEKIKQFDI